MQMFKKCLSRIAGRKIPIMLVEKDAELLLAIFEEIFNHKSFTEGLEHFLGMKVLGSIYWHMVSKLALAVQECCVKAIEQEENETW